MPTENLMMKEIDSLPSLFEKVYKDYAVNNADLVPKDIAENIQQVYITGCGDSFCAAAAMEMLFEKITKISTIGANAMRVGRYKILSPANVYPEKTLVIGISVSGEAARTYEALKLAKQSGMYTMAITGSHDSRLASVSHFLNLQSIPALHPGPVKTPGVISYFTSMLSLVYTSIYLGFANGSLTANDLQIYKKKITLIIEAIKQTINNNKILAYKLAQDTINEEKILFMGSGPNYATAYFLKAKLAEASGDLSVAQDLEEWAHVDYYSRYPVLTFLLNSGGLDNSRFNEVLVAVNKIGSKSVVTIPEDVVIEKSDYSFEYFPNLTEPLSPFLTCIPGMLFTAYRAEMLGEKYYRSFSGGRGDYDGGGICRVRSSELFEL